MLGTELCAKPLALAEFVTNCPHFLETKEERKGAIGILRRDPRSGKSFGVWKLVEIYRGEDTPSIGLPS